MPQSSPHHASSPVNSPTRQRPRRALRGRIEPLLIPIQDAFEALGVGNTTGYALVGAGYLETRKIGRSTLVTTESLRATAATGATISPKDKRVGVD